MCWGVAAGRSFLALIIASLLLPVAAEAAAPKRVMVLHSFGREFAPFDSVGEALRSELVRVMQKPVLFQEASLEAERIGPPEDEHLLVDFLRNRYAAAPPDLMIAIGAPAMRFYLRHRQALFPDCPLLVAGVDRRVAHSVLLESRDRLVSFALDLPRVAHNILQVLPQTTTLAVVVGSSPFERFWLGELQADLAPLADRVKLLWLTDLSLEQLRQRVASLPPHSAVFYGVFAADVDGVPQENERALALVRAASTAPVFGVFEEQLGSGIVGGPLIRLRAAGIAAARTGQRMLEQAETGGERVQLIPIDFMAFDWRELDRWSIPESRLPEGSEVRFRAPSMWEQHKLPILAGAAVLLLQTVLIAALLLQRTRRRRAEQEAFDLAGRLITAHEDERRRLARELHDDLTQRLARLAIDAGQLERSPEASESMTAMREDLVRLSEDVHTLSYRLHPSVLDDLGLVEALKAECDRAARHGALRIDVEANGVPQSLPIDTSLCVFRVAQEALSNATRHAGASAITVLLSPRGKGLQLAISDNGSGFDTTSARSRASLGLASMRERVRLVRGELDIESTPGRGTTVVAWVPA